MDSTNGEPIANIVQSRLRRNDIHFSTMSTEEGLSEIMKLLQEGNKEASVRSPLLEKGTRFEAAIVKDHGSKITRTTITSLKLDKRQ